MSLRHLCADKLCEPAARPPRFVHFLLRIWSPGAAERHKTDKFVVRNDTRHRHTHSHIARLRLSQGRRSKLVSRNTQVSKQAQPSTPVTSRLGTSGRRGREPCLLEAYENFTTFAMRARPFSTESPFPLTELGKSLSLLYSHEDGRICAFPPGFDGRRVHAICRLATVACCCSPAR